MWLYTVALAALILPAAAFAQENPVKLYTDSDSYRAGDLMVVYGSVTPLPHQQLTLKIQTGSGVVQVDQLAVSEDGTYTYLVNTSGAQWKEGQYSILVRYGENSAALNVDFVDADAADAASMLEVPDGAGGTFDVRYEIRGGTVDDMEVDFENLAIRVSVSAERDGVLLVDLPRRYIDAERDGSDEAYIVLVDGVPYPHGDDMGRDVRQLEVRFPRGTGEILVIGTMVVPEFGAALWLLAAAAAAGTAAARRALPV